MKTVISSLDYFIIGLSNSWRDLYIHTVMQEFFIKKIKREKKTFFTSQSSGDPKIYHGIPSHSPKPQLWGCQ